jgi:ABC-type transport system involved in cytochrome bd biosynthesis fused ATPase/permease subunit
MLTLAIMAGMLFLFLTGVAGVVVGAIAAGFFFLCGLPLALITGFVHGEVSYAQDRADYREELSEMAADELAAQHEYAEDERVNRLVAAARKKQRDALVSVDNRQAHIHGRMPWN